MGPEVLPSCIAEYDDFVEKETIGSDIGCVLAFPGAIRQVTLYVHASCKMGVILSYLRNIVRVNSLTFESYSDSVVVIGKSINHHSYHDLVHNIIH